MQMSDGPADQGINWKVKSYRSRSRATFAVRLARRLTTILPGMLLAEAIETTRIHRVAGLTGDRTAVITTHPCHSFHQTISDVGLIGRGHVPMPGEVSPAHHGVLFLDELPECRHHILEVLRQPLEESVIYLQSRGRPESSCFRRVSYTAHDLSGLGQRTVAAHQDGDDHHALSASPPHPLQHMQPSHAFP
jgi:hypothetical protein